MEKIKQEYSDAQRIVNILQKRDKASRERILAIVTTYEWVDPNAPVPFDVRQKSIEFGPTVTGEAE